jgi:hypothetical protein
MPDPMEYDNRDEWMKACVPMVMGENGGDNDAAVGKCIGMWANKTASKSFNIEERQYKLNDAFEQLYPSPKPIPMPVSEAEQRPYICDYYDDFVIVCDKGINYKVPYTLNGEKIEFVQRSDWKESISTRMWVASKKGNATTNYFYGDAYFGNFAVKAVGEWELDVLVIPFGSRDSDGQWFDANTDIKEDAYSTPLAIYHHGIKQGARGLEENPIVIGSTLPGSLKKQMDGWHLRLLLNKALQQAKDVMQAAYKKMVAVSSDSISHLARLEIGGKLIQYEKNKPGRIAVWPLAGYSLWELGNGNFRPANHRAIALPAMKAMYRQAGLPFPNLDTHGVAEAKMVRRRAEVKAKAIQILEKIK